jgi:hypothetical protein
MGTKEYNEMEKKVRWKAKCFYTSVRHRISATSGSDLVKLQVIMAVSVQTVVLWALPIIISLHWLLYGASVSRLCNFEGRITGELQIEKNYDRIDSRLIIQSDSELLSEFSWPINGNLDNNLESPVLWCHYFHGYEILLILWRLLGNNLVAVNRALANHGLGSSQCLATAM